MTTKQITTLVLFSQNYSLVTIAKKQKVSLTTIRQRIKALSKNHSKEFNNALGLRNTYKRNRDALRSTLNFSSLFRDVATPTNDIKGTLDADDITDMIKDTF